MLSDERSLLKEQIIGAREFRAEYRFQLGIIPVTVSIRFYRRISDGNVEFEQSHFIRTPLDKGLRIAGKVFYKTIALALEEAVNSFTVPYNQAIDRGFDPDPSWLAPNESF